MKRIYSILVFGNEENDIMLVLKFTDQKFQSLSDFLNSEVHNFYLHVREALESVITGKMEEYAFDGNMLGIEIGKEITEVLLPIWGRNIRCAMFYFNWWTV